MKTITLVAILLAGWNVTTAETNRPPATNVVVLNAHQQFYRAIEIRRSQLRAQRAPLEDARDRLQKVISAKGGVLKAKAENAEQKKYIAALEQIRRAERAVDVQVAEYELRYADARHWANWWARTNRADPTRSTRGQR